IPIIVMKIVQLTGASQPIQKPAAVAMTESFRAIGISHQTSSLDERAAFALNPKAQRSLLTEARRTGIQGLMVLSTCNRTELYAMDVPESVLIDLLLAYCEADQVLAQAHVWTKAGEAAIGHLIRVGSGLDSMILGDLQIINQVKQAWQMSQEAGLDHPLLERWMNVAIYTSRQVKNQTDLCKGSATIAYSAIKAIQVWCDDHQVKRPRVAILGLGEIGKTCCLHALKYLPDAQVTVSNRRPEKALALVEKVKGALEMAAWEARAELLASAEVVLVATAAASPVVEREMISGAHKQLFLDLSVPANIDPAIGEQANKYRLDIDHLSKLTDESLVVRKIAVPKAEAIVQEEVRSFLNWLDKKRLSPLIGLLKAELSQVQQAELEKYQQKHPEADVAAAEFVGNQLISTLTAKLAGFINDYHQELGEELQSVHQKLREHVA
ncbi:MAG: glutamyl-tRNA reductase, partial [Bacteroidota bacterium]